MSIAQTVAVDAIIVVSLIGIAVGRIPRLRMNRATIAFAGAACLIALGGLSAAEAFAAIDMGTLILILSMMIITANLKLAGFFETAGAFVLRTARTPRKLLAAIMAASAVLSALFLNDTICIMMTPLVAGLCIRAERDPMPYLLGLALSANIGSAATIIGNPQNMLIGAASGISFARFFVKMAIPALAGTIIAYFVTLIAFKSEFSHEVTLRAAPTVSIRAYKPLLVKSALAVAVMILGFILKMHVAAAAMLGATILLTTRRIKPERVFAELDWTIIAFFGGLFVITEAIGKNPAFEFLVLRGMPLVGQDMGRFAFFTVILSNLVSNVPAVMVMRPLAGWFADPEKAWLAMAMASTFAGNLTLLGSVANLIVAESAARYGVRIRFVDYLKVGLPTTACTVAVGAFVLAWT